MPNGSFYNLKGNIYYCMLVEKSLSCEMVHFTFLIVGLYYSYGIWDQKMVHFIISKVIFTIVFPKKVTVKWNGILYHSNWCMCYSYGISDQKMVHLLISKVRFTIACSVKSCSQVKWYILPFQLTYILFLWYIRPGKEAKFIFSCCWSSLVLSVLNHFEIRFKKQEAV